MILTRKDLKEYIAADAKACERTSTRAKIYGDETWKYQLALRKWEYHYNQTGIKKIILLPARLLSHIRYHHLGVKLDLQISVNVFDKGLSIAHFGCIHIALGVNVGKNCRIHQGVSIGPNSDDGSVNIGNNVFISDGAKILSNITIADDVVIGANAVVTKDILEPGTTWGGVPAKKISDNNSHIYLNQELIDNL